MAKTGAILLIDDDRDEYELLKVALRELGIKNELIHFPMPPEAFHYLKVVSTPPFLILSDINMPKMTGIELRRQINADEEVKRKSIPFIFLTTSASVMAVKEAYEMSVQGFFEKPPNHTDYVKMIKMIYDYWQICRHPNN